jgi:3-(3-hydroxy-phenyl)propionate hydroxylase
MAGIEMARHAEAQTFSVYEIEATGELPDEVRVVLEADLTSVYWPLEQGRCRWGFQIHDASDHAASMQKLEHLIAARAPWFTARPLQIYWSTLGLFERQLARTFARQSVLLAGDAAHQAGPVAVHSMNAGLVEAHELASRIARIQRSEGKPTLLDEFEVGSRQAWEWLLDASSPSGGALRPLPGASPWIHQNAARILACLPASGDDLEPLLNQVGLTASRT